MKPSGGKRLGAGRKAGAINLFSRKIREEALATGMLPHQILLALGRGEQVAGFGILDDATRIECLKAAAPYYAPRLAAAVVKEHEGNDGRDVNPWDEIMHMVSGGSRGLPAEVSERLSGTSGMSDMNDVQDVEVKVGHA